MMTFEQSLPDKLEKALSLHEEKWGDKKPEYWTKKWEDESLELIALMRDVRDEGLITKEIFDALFENYFGNLMCCFMGHNPEHERDALRWLCSPEVLAQVGIIMDEDLLDKE